MESKRVVSAFGWKFFERIFIQMGHFIISMILARLLTPNDYGMIALVTVFISLATTFVQAGFNTALIQKKDISDNDYISVIFFSIVVVIILYMVLFCGSPFLERFYNMPGYKNVMRMMGLGLFPGAIQSVQLAYLTKKMKFRELAISNLGAVFISAFIGILMAINGKGVWALVVQNLSSQIISCIIIFIMSKWIPKGRVSLTSLRNMIPFGIKVFTSNIMVTLFLNFRSLIIGKLYTSDDLGYFNKGKQFPQTIMESINSTIQSVLLPLYSKKQDKLDYVVSMLGETVKITNFLIFPMLVGLACVAEPIIKILLTDKWISCVPFIIIFAFSYMCQPFQISSTQAYLAIGDSKTPLILEIFRKSAEILLVLISLRYGTLAIAMTSLIAGVVSMLITFIPNKIKLGYTVRRQFFDIAVPLLLSGIMAGVILVTGSFIDNIILKLIVQVLLGIAVYIGISKIFNVYAYSVIMKIIKSYIKK